MVWKAVVVDRIYDIDQQTGLAIFRHSIHHYHWTNCVNFTIFRECNLPLASRPAKVTSEKHLALLGSLSNRP